MSQAFRINVLPQGGFAQWLRLRELAYLRKRGTTTAARVQELRGILERTHCNAMLRSLAEVGCCLEMELSTLLMRGQTIPSSVSCLDLGGRLIDSILGNRHLGPLSSHQIAVVGLESLFISPLLRFWSTYFAFLCLAELGC
ncbi:predicted protein [Histoplasma capsulatum H143]|uniref:Uncharacterized protein n=1 Tax=Ajellomyces capsulatus (strain H143) TaxID=544712 RepID=C6HRT6_AJECH|nr:predicted protein [Histoplasma capsulatum H143]